MDASTLFLSRELRGLTDKCEASQILDATTVDIPDRKSEKILERTQNFAPLPTPPPQAALHEGANTEFLSVPAFFFAQGLGAAQPSHRSEY
jgi:hypothetical protein